MFFFSIFNKESNAKKSRAINLAEDERQLAKAKDFEILRLREELRNSFKLKEFITQKISKYSLYNEFMKKVQYLNSN